MQLEGSGSSIPGVSDTQQAPAQENKVNEFYSTRAIDSLLERAEAGTPLQEASRDIWEKKYQLRSKNGVIVDKTVDESLLRVAKALAETEKDQAYWTTNFLKALRAGAVPAGRIMSNAGAQGQKPGTSTINCVVSGTIPDSMDGILAKVHEAGLSLKAGCGIGYEFSSLRPQGAEVSGVGAITNGPLAFMDIYDSMCFTVSSAGGRRGAQMATFDVHHPDVELFITAKRQDRRLKQFNLSLLITQDFIEAVKSDSEWVLSFPLTPKKLMNKDDSTEIIYRDMPWLHDQQRYATDQETGQVACMVYKKLRARDLWDLMMRSTYEYSDPGFILVDRINEMNNNWFCEDLRATNPCGEQPLPPYGSCLLGSINLTRFVVNPFTSEAYFDFDAFEETVRIFTRMLDNVVEMNGLPLKQQQQEIESKRRHGMGYLGLGSSLALLGIRYGSEESLKFTERLTYLLAVNGLETGVQLSKEKGEAPILQQLFEIDNRLMHKARKRGILLQGNRVRGRELLLLGRYMGQFSETSRGSALLESILAEGLRFTHHSSIAPTGTISLSVGNNASNGIEPSFSHFYSRNVIREGKATKEQVEVCSYEFLRYREFSGQQDVPPDQIVLPASFITADDLTPKEHVDVQAAAQKWIDSSISKTCNVPADIPYEDLKEVYLYAASKGLKGCTTFRYNPAVTQGVLIKAADMAKTFFDFILEDGTKITARADQQIEYLGEIHNAGNLADAIKGGTYGRL